MNFYSQDGQDKFVLDYYEHRANGFFVDIGAHNGVTLSNTKVLEEIGWGGVCVEPIPERFEELNRNRKCKCFKNAVSKAKGDVEFLRIKGYSEMLSGIREKYDPKHLKRIEKEIKDHGGSCEIIMVSSVPFAELIDVKHIDYLSIDVEGAEMDVLESIDFSIYKIGLLSLECNYSESVPTSYLQSRGFQLIKRIGCDLFFERHGSG